MFSPVNFSKEPPLSGLVLLGQSLRLGAEALQLGLGLRSVVHRETSDLDVHLLELKKTRSIFLSLQHRLNLESPLVLPNFKAEELALFEAR